MEKTWVSMASFLAAICLAGCASAPPKQSWEKEPSPSEASTQPAQPEEKVAEPSHEDVCRKMWSMISTEAEAAAKKTSGKKKHKLPTDADRDEFMKDCVESGQQEKKEHPKSYACQRKCILDSDTTKEVEACGKACP